VVQGSGFRVQGLGFRVQGSGFRVQGSGFRVQGLGFRVQGLGFRVQGLGFRVQGSGKCLHLQKHVQSARQTLCCFPSFDLLMVHIYISLFNRLALGSSELEFDALVQPKTFF